MYNIMLVDDHDIVREGIAKLLSRSNKLRVSASVESIHHLFVSLEKEVPDLILLDLKLKDGDGISTAIQLKKKYPRIKIVILSGYIEPHLAQEAKRVGVEGYLLKTIDSNQLILSVLEVLDDKLVYDEKVEVSSHEISPFNFQKLSSQEYSLIRLLALGKTSKEIAQIMEIKEKTVRNYTTRLYAKINVNNRSEAVAFYMINNYIEGK